MTLIQIIAGDIILEVEPFNTKTATEIIRLLPFSSRAMTWGDEVYFSTPVKVEKEENARDIVEPGELAFWVEGQSIAIGFGPTPISKGDEIRLADTTNIWGRSITNVKILSRVKPGDPIRVKLKN